MMRRASIVLLLALLVGGFPAPTRAQGNDAASGAYCEPAPQSKLLYSNR